MLDQQIISNQFQNILFFIAPNSEFAAFWNRSDVLLTILASSPLSSEAPSSKICGRTFYKEKKKN